MLTFQIFRKKFSIKQRAVAFKKISKKRLERKFVTNFTTRDDIREMTYGRYKLLDNLALYRVINYPGPRAWFREIV